MQWLPLALLGLSSGLQVAIGVGASGALEDGNYCEYTDYMEIVGLTHESVKDL